MKNIFDFQDNINNFNPIPLSWSFKDTTGDMGKSVAIYPVLENPQSRFPEQTGCGSGIIGLDNAGYPCIKGRN